MKFWFSWKSKVDSDLPFSLPAKRPCQQHEEMLNLPSPSSLRLERRFERYLDSYSKNILKELLNRQIATVFIYFLPFLLPGLQHFLKKYLGKLLASTKEYGLFGTMIIKVNTGDTSQNRKSRFWKEYQPSKVKLFKINSSRNESPTPQNKNATGEATYSLQFCTLLCLFHMQALLY